MAWTADEWRRVGLSQPKHIKPVGYQYAGEGMAKVAKEKPAALSALIKALRSKDDYVVRYPNATQGIRG